MGVFLNLHSPFLATHPSHRHENTEHTKKNAYDSSERA
jgi:hypothetical protein